MPIKKDLGYKNCLECGTLIKIKLIRDIDRKKFCCRNCTGSYYGKKRTLEFMRMVNQAGCTPENNLKKAHKGKDHPLYKQDRSQIKSPRPRYEQTEWKKQILKRDDYTCQICKVRGGKLNVDHIKPYCICSEEEKWSLENGRTLCVSCHKNTKTYGRKRHNLIGSF